MLILVERSHTCECQRGQVKGTPLHFHPEKHFLSQSSPELGAAASRMSKLPVPGDVYMKAGQPRLRDAAEGTPALDGTWIPSNPETLWFLTCMVALESHQQNLGNWDRDLTPGSFPIPFQEPPVGNSGEGPPMLTPREGSHTGDRVQEGRGHLPHPLGLLTLYLTIHLTTIVSHGWKAPICHLMLEFPLQQP